MKFQFLLDEFVQNARQRFGETLTGVYFYGSLALLTCCIQSGNAGTCKQPYPLCRFHAESHPRGPRLALRA